MSRRSPGLDTRSRDEHILGSFKAKERLRRWHELQKQRQEEDENE